MEILEGYVVDLACIRRYPVDQLAERAKAHGRKCALMGHCVESGYGLVSDRGKLVVLDASATPLVVAAVKAAAHPTGIKLKAVRETNDGEMRTISVEEV